MESQITLGASAANLGKIQRRHARIPKKPAADARHALRLWRIKTGLSFVILGLFFLAIINPRLNIIRFPGARKMPVRQALAYCPAEPEFKDTCSLGNYRGQAEEIRLMGANRLRKEIEPIIKGTPMMAMLDDIANRNRAVAAFIVGIAMKESKFGIYSPKKEGVECYNYWGYRGKENTTASGYSCFDSPSHAIRVVGSRIESIVMKGVKTPEQMISWKCGSTCDGHDPYSVTKWISDVAINYYRLNPKALARNN